MSGHLDHGDFKPGDLITYTVRTRKMTAEVVREVERVVVSGGLTMLFLVGGGWMQGNMVSLKARSGDV